MIGTNANRPGSGKISQWNITPSQMAKNTVNPIRQIVDGMTITPNPNKELIRLTIGDPTVFGNMDTAQECVEAVVEAARSGKHNGYPSSVGTTEARQAVADYSTSMGAPATAGDVVLTSGCSQSLELAINLLANPGQNVLIPRPGFPLYMTLTHGVGVQTRFYDLLPEKGWQVDLKSLEDQIDENTAAVIVNSPSNPCGGVFSREHMLDIIDICNYHKIPIISDEVYENVVYGGKRHHSFASVSEHVPIFSVSSIAKRFLVPGWRLGWLIVHDRRNAVSDELRRALVSLTQRTLGPCSILQGALPQILGSTPASMFEHTNSIVEENSMMLFDQFSNMRGLLPIKPSGALYMMVKIDLDCFPDFASDVEFTERLMTEESVFCLPASCFSLPGYFRVVLSVPQDKSLEACSRIMEFCERHHMQMVPGGVVDKNGVEINGNTVPKGRCLQRITSSFYLKG